MMNPRTLAFWALFAAPLSINGEHDGNNLSQNNHISTVTDSSAAIRNLAFKLTPWEKTTVSEAADSLALSDDGKTMVYGFDETVKVLEFNEASSAWDVKETIETSLPNNNPDDKFGHSVCISGDGETIAVGASEYDGTIGGINAFDSGAAQMYTKGVSGTWGKKGSPIVGISAEDKHGFSLSLNKDGTVVAIGAPYNDGTQGTSDSGSVRVFEWNSNTSSWVLRGAAIIGEAADDESGYSVSLDDSGNTIAIGAIKNDGENTGGSTIDDVGHLRVLSYDGTEWTRKGGDIDGALSYSRLGLTVDLSGDGTVLAVGAPGTALSDESGNQPVGSASVYEYIDGNWMKKGAIQNFEGTQPYGKAVSISKDGTKFAVGNPDTSTSGSVEVWEWNPASSSWDKGNDLFGGSSTGTFGSMVKIAGNGSNLAVAGVPIPTFIPGGPPPTPTGGQIDVYEISEVVPDEEDGPTVAAGDPHFQALNGELFSYHGQCDLVFLKSSEVEVHIRTTRVESVHQMKYSYISGAAIQIGNDVLEVAADGSLLINGSEETVVETFAGLPLIKTFKGKKHLITMYELIFGKNKSIQIRVNTKGGLLFVHTIGTFPSRVGLLGSREGLLARDGVTNLSGQWNTLGEQWQVLDSEPKLFADKNRKPQYPEGCVYEDLDKDQTKTHLRRRLLADPDNEVDEESAAQACANAEGNKRDFCIADVLATGDLDLSEDSFYNM